MRGLMVWALGSALLSFGSTGAAQSRVSDKDIARLMNNLKEDSEKFGENFKKDLPKSSIRKTSEEKAAKQLSEQFPKQVEGMMKQFKSKKNVDAALATVQASYKRLGDYMTKITPNTKTTEWWTKVQQGMTQVSQALNAPLPG